MQIHDRTDDERAMSSMWWQAELHTGADDAEILASLLEAAGALSVTHLPAPDSPDLLEPQPGEFRLWQQGRLQALFAGQLDGQKLQQQLTISLGRAVELVALKDADWLSSWRQYVTPRCFGGRLWICPEDQQTLPDGVCVLLNPGLAFGTGSHPSTALCLQWLATRSLQGKVVIDVGCGSGILAIAALCLGAKHAIAIDHDPQALHATRENAEKNGVLSRLEVADGLVSKTRGDFVVANILCDTLCDLAPTVLGALAPHGELALAGILRPQAGRVRAAYSPHVLALAPKIAAPDYDQGDWVLLASGHGGDLQLADTTFGATDRTPDLGH